MMPEQKIKSVNEWADFWRYEIGVNVIPANTKYKKPAVDSWTQWQTNPIPIETHNRWKETNAFESGMAVIVGKVWHNELKNGLYLCAIDCDNGLAVQELTPKGIIHHASKTLIEWHPDDSTKCHIYFYTHKPVPKKSSDTVSPSQVEKLSANQIPAIEVKGDGKHGIMYVTPSPHKNGANYEIVGTEQPVILDEIDIWINNICKKYGISYLDTVKNNSSLIPMNDLLNDETQILEGHNRHLGILRYADHVYATSPPSITDALVYDIIKAKNEKLCSPPLDADELVKLQEQAKAKVHEWNKEKPVTESTKSKGKKHTDYTDEIMQQYHFVTLDDTKEILYYDEGVYRFGGEILIEKRCEQMIEDCNRDVVNEVIAAVRRRTYAPRKWFDQDQDMINVRNAWINIKTGDILPHSANRLSRIQLPVYYDPLKKCPKFLSFLEQCIPDESDRYTILEQFASCLIKSAKFGKAFMWIGQGMNGKSTMLSIIEGCLGIESVSHISIHSFEDNRFAKAELDSKLANIYADISNEELNTASEFKALVTGDPVLAEKKNKNPFVMTNSAKMFFSANQIPIVYDESDGFFRRFMIMEWNQKFDDKKADKNLKQKILTEDEKSGILNLLLEYSKELDERGFFKYVESVEVLRSRWKTKSDSIKSFLDNELVYDESYFIPKARLFEAYKNYCVDNKLFAKSMKKFHDDIKQMTVLIDDPVPKKIDDKSTRIWRGATLKRDMPKQGELS